MGFTKTEPSNHQSENTWFTPKQFIDVLGPFDLDPCSVTFRPHDTAHTHIEHDIGECGIEMDWYGNVWCNPPYGKQIMPFVDKFIQHQCGIMLVFARMDSEYMQKLIRAGAYVYCLRKRVKFIRKDGTLRDNAGTGSCLVFFNRRYIPRVEFFKGVLIGG